MIISLLYSLFAHNLLHNFFTKQFFSLIPTLLNMFDFIIISPWNIDNLFINLFFKRILWNIMKFMKRQGKIINSFNFKVSVIICFIYMIKTLHSISSFSLHLDLISWNEKNALKGRHFWRETVSSLCSYYQYQKIIIWCTWAITIILWFNFCRWIVSKFIFFTRVL